MVSSSERTTCDSNLLFYQPLLPVDSLLHHLHSDANAAPSDLIPRHYRISIQAPRKQPYKKQPVKNEPSSFLLEKLVGDVAIAVGVTFCVAPFLTIVDKAIVQRAAGSHTSWTSGLESMRVIARNPIRYIKSPTFLLMWGVYASTYSTANSLKTYTEHCQHQEERRQTTTTTTNPTTTSTPSSSTTVGAPLSGLTVFLGTTVVNSGGSLIKDRAYARMFGTVAKRSVPKITYGLWMTRDFLVIGSSFVLPDLCASHLHKKYDYDKDKAKQVAQVTIPVAMQFIAGPLQLLGLDCYNRSLSEMTTRQAVLERGRFLSNGFTSIVSARIARIVPGYSIGGVLNTKYRDQWRSYLRNQEVSPLRQFAWNKQAKLPAH
jgi:hypothetical protein